MTELEQIEAGLAALEAQRGVLGNAVLELAAAPLRERRRALRAPAPAEAQHLKQVSVMFVDVVGSTALSQRLDPEEIDSIIGGAMADFTDVVQQQGGRVLQYTGDGVLAAFGAVEVREDDAERAVLAGLGVLARARERAARLQSERGLPGFDVRVGITTGPVLLGGGVDGEASIRGATVNLAARMEQTAPVGALRISLDTYRHVRGVFQVQQQPPLIVKGSDQPVQTYLVLGTKPRAFRVVNRGIEGVETRMVARDAEFEQLQQAFHRLFDAPTLTAVVVVADAGLSKSRLLYEFENWAEAQAPSYFLFRARAQPQTQSEPYGLLRDVLAWRLQIADSDDADTARRKLVAAAAPLLGDDGEAHAHLLGQLIGFDFSQSPHLSGILDDAKQIRNRGFHAAALLLRRHATGPGGLPLVLLLDDLHWADDGTLDFIHHLVQVNRDVPMLMLCMARPGLFERRPNFASVPAVFSRIDLEPLDKQASRELTGLLLQRLADVPAALRELVIGGAEGNPFYMEEMVRMLIDNGAIVTVAERWQLVPERLLAVHVPSTLTGVLQARIDSLAPAEKLALQQAAVIGYVFWDQTLAALDLQAPAALPALVKRGLVMPREQSSFEGQREYAFKQQLLHQVVVESTLKRQRRAWHAQAAAWLAQTLGAAADHYERAGDADNALHFFTRAAEHAAARYANAAMLGFVQRALALLDAGGAAATDPRRWPLLLLREGFLRYQPERAAHAADLEALAALADAQHDDARRAQVLLCRAGTCNDAGDHAAAEAAARAGLALVEGIEDAPMAVALHSALAAALIPLGDYAGARQVAERGMALAHVRADQPGESSLLNVTGVIATQQGDLTLAADCFERSLAIERDTGNRAREGSRITNVGSVYLRLGYYERARQRLDEGLRVARATGRRDVESLVLLNTGLVEHRLGDDRQALGCAEAALEAAGGQRELRAFARFVSGHAESGLGRHDAARLAYTESRQLMRELEMRRQQALDPASGLVRVALAQGRVDEALAEARDILAYIDAGGSLDGCEEPLLIPWSCHLALAAAGDPRAAALLADAHADLQAQAGRIGDVQARHSFLQRVPYHRQIVEAWHSRGEPRAAARLPAAA